MIYAISDELHQMLIDGRAARITDVLIDSLGIISSIILRRILLYDLEEGKWKN